MKALTRKPLESGDQPLHTLPAETSDHDVRLEIRELNANLEERVRERTAELEATNSKLSGLIAERLRVEVALRESEERFRTIFEQAAVGMALVETATGRFVRINHGYCDLLGYSVEEMTGTAFQTITHPDDLEEDLENMRQLVAGEIGAFAMEKRYFRKDGSLVWVHLTVSPTWRAGETPKYHIAIVEDITERKQVETALRQSETRYHSIFQAAGVSIWEEDFSAVVSAIDRLKSAGIRDFRRYFAEHPDFVDEMIGLVKIVDVNDETLRLYGARDKHELLKSLHAIFVPETREVFIGALLAVAEGRTSFTSETVVRTLQGLRFNIIFTIAFPPATAGFESVLVSIMNITERKQVEDALRQSEERFRLVVEAAPSGMLMIGPNGTIVIANAQIEKMFGYSRAELLGQPIELLVPDCYRHRHPQHRDDFFSAPQARGMGASRDLHGRHKDGRDVPVEIGLNPIQSESGLLVLAAVIDISERKQAESQLNATLEQLHGLTAHLESVREEERTRIAREIHDELGQALTILKFDSVWIKSQLTRAVRDQHRDPLLARAENMSSLIDTTIQTMRRIVTELRPSILDKFGLAAAMEWQGQEFQKRTGIRCTVDVRDHGLDLDRSTAVFRIVQEALTNVARHAAATAVDVRSYREAQNLVLIVEDNGRGIVETNVSARDSFGLLGMRERAAAAGGGLQIVSSPERGTRIKVQVPLPAPHWIASAPSHKSKNQNPQSKRDSKS